jgi:glycosyltransferase involved in cell wall biosynthesis
MIVLIATAGRPDLLRRTLASIAACRIPRRYAGTIVVENGARRGVEEVVREFSVDPLKAQYLFSETPNKSRALNLALRGLSGDELVVFTDDDVRVREDWLEAYAEGTVGTVGGVIFGGPFEVDYEEEPPHWVRRYLPISARGMNGAGEWPISSARFKGFLGFNWAAFAVDLQEAGGFNEQVGPGTMSTGQETEMQQRLQRRNIDTVLLPGAMVWHYVPRDRCSPEWVLERAYRHGRARGIRERAQIRSMRSSRSMELGPVLRATIARALLASRYSVERRLPGRTALARFQAARLSARHRGWMHGLWDTEAADGLLR